MEILLQPWKVKWCDKVMQQLSNDYFVAEYISKM